MSLSKIGISTSIPQMKYKTTLLISLIGIGSIIGCSKSSDPGTSSNNQGQNSNPTTPTITIPLAPSSLIVDSVSNSKYSYHKVYLSWTDNSTTEQGFKIERKTLSTNFTLVGTVGTNVIGFIDSTVSPNIQYSYRVYAYNTAGSSTNYSNVDTANVFGLAIGQSYQGGKIAYFLQSGDPGYINNQVHGLIIPSSDQSGSTGTALKYTGQTYTEPWAGSTPFLATSTAIGTGAKNTSLMVQYGYYQAIGGKLGRPSGSIENDKSFLEKPKSLQIMKGLRKGLTIREISKVNSVSSSTIMKVKSLMAGSITSAILQFIFTISVVTLL
ncbi:hypothetical protein ABIB62_002472 [Mucilaginibacter sp. UYP25]|uniref:fibronectin type III domain-containing protein n=1 Tax=unclassified Mucilaginibacter TaxID=2617802 RepID=UPI00339B76DC